jgi:hypothetical protein
MKTITAILILVGILLICCVGACAAIFSIRSLDRWCVRHLSDTEMET